MSYKVARIEEIEDIDYRQDTHMRPVRHHLGVTAFGTNAWTVENVGDRLLPEHEEDEGSEELYVVLRGRARFEIGGEAVDAPVQGHLPAPRGEPGFDVEARPGLLDPGAVPGERTGQFGAGVCPALCCRNVTSPTMSPFSIAGNSAAPRSFFPNSR